MKIVIVGADHAGIAAANAILADYDHEVIMIEAGDKISYVGAGTPVWVGNQIDDFHNLFYATPQDLADSGATMIMETKITRVDYDKKVVFGEGKDGKTVEESYDKLILTTGSKPIAPNLPGKDLEGIHFLKTFEEGQAVESAMSDENVKRIGVIGAGYIGVEIAEAIRLRGKEVVIFDAEQHTLMNYYDEEFAVLMDNNLKENGIETHFGEFAQGYIGNNDGHVTGLQTDKGEYEVDLVINCIGFRPNAELAGDHLETFANGAYLVDRYQQTSDPHVYAAGDCATIFANAQQQTGYIALASNAIRTGRLAGLNVAGESVASPGVQGSNAISIFGLNLASTGLSVRSAKRFNVDVEYVDYEDTQLSPYMINHQNDKVKIRIVFEKGSRRIVGAQLASHLNISMVIHMFSLAIEQQYTIDQLQLLDLFYLPHFNQPYNYITLAAQKAGKDKE